MRILVTGAAGFIGQHVTRALKEAGHEVVGLDLPVGPNLSTSAEFIYFDEWLAADITQPLQPIPGLDAVIHLAALSHPRQCDENPEQAFTINVTGTSNVLRMALASGARKFVFSSSAHVYDIPPKYLPSDEVHPLRLNNTYTTTKILGEQLCELYYQNHGLNYTVLRLFNAYGPGQQPGYFIPDMIAKAKTGAIDLKGAGTTKDWVYVEDVARAFCLAVESPFVGAVNIGTGVQTDLGTIASRIASLQGAKYTGVPSGRDTCMCADVGRAYRILGWKPTVDIEGGIDAVLNLAKA